MDTISASNGTVNGYSPHKRFLGAVIPNWLLCRREVSQGAKLCFARLAQHAGKADRCFPKLETLAVELGVSDRSVKDYIAELCGHGLIVRQRMGQGRANTYLFVLHPWIEFKDERQDASPQQSDDRQDSAQLEGKHSSRLERQDSAPPILRESGKRISEENKSGKAALLVELSESEFRAEADRQGLKGWGNSTNGYGPAQLLWNYHAQRGGFKSRDHMRNAIAKRVQQETSKCAALSHL